MIDYLRKTYNFEPVNISMYLKRYHDLEVGTSGVWRIKRSPSEKSFRGSGT